jgi:hypothetical protein
MKNKRLLLPLLLVLITNTIVLAGVAYNRTGEPEASLILTERELTETYKNDENSGISLQLNWDLPKYSEYGSRNFSEDLFTAEKLREIHFPCVFVPTKIVEVNCFKRHLPFKVFLALEYEGQSWVQWQEGNDETLQKQIEKLALESDSKQIKNMKRQIGNLERLPLIKSRLFVIDLDASAEALRQKYPDKSKYIITPGLIRVSIQKVMGPDKYKLNGWVNEVLIDQIHVEPRWREFFETLPKNKYSRYSSYETPMSQIKPRYQVTLKYGQRHEPWIENIKKYQ